MLGSSFHSARGRPPEAAQDAEEARLARGAPADDEDVLVADIEAEVGDQDGGGVGRRYGDLAHLVESI